MNEENCDAMYFFHGDAQCNHITFTYYRKVCPTIPYAYFNDSNFRSYTQTFMLPWEELKPIIPSRGNRLKLEPVLTQAKTGG